MRTVVIPMAGLGTRFKEVHEHKVLYPIPSSGAPMFVHAVKTLGFSFDRLILVTLARHGLRELAGDHLDALEAELVELPDVTDGPADTVLKARPLLEQHPESEVVICNADQSMDWPGDWAMEWFVRRGAEGGIPTQERTTNRHSYCIMDPQEPHRVLGVKEKERVSPRATIGVYWFRRAAGFLEAADRMWAADDRAPNGEFYIGPMYNHLNGLILEFPLCEFWSLGEPENIRAYLAGDRVAAARD